MVKVLFVCFGNVCRSPMAQGILVQRLRRVELADRVQVRSAGTHAYHLNAAPDPRAQAAMVRRGIDIGDIRARRLAREDFEEFDYLIAMDRENYRFLRELCPVGRAGKLSMLMEYATDLHALDVPDPYYGAETWFDRVLDLIDAGTDGLLAALLRRHFPEIRSPKSED
jgi:low molecular weight protein-tyrosine phosphatase